MIHRDRFAIGDVVTWRDEDKATMTKGRERLGNRLVIGDVREVTRSLRDVGHTQHVTIEGDKDAGFNSNQWCWSGAFFRHLGEGE